MKLIVVKKFQYADDLMIITGSNQYWSAEGGGSFVKDFEWIWNEDYGKYDEGRRTSLVLSFDHAGNIGTDFNNGNNGSSNTMQCIKEGK